jgi:hypothetical protein
MVFTAPADTRLAEEPLDVEPVEPAGVTAAPPRETAAPTRRCPECGERIPADAGRCRFCKARLDEEEDEEYGRRRLVYKPCPRCGGQDARQVIWTFWGSFYGPAMLTHVRCPDCGYAYNGRTGRSNLVPAVIFVTIPLLLILAIVGGLFFLILSMR